MKDVADCGACALGRSAGGRRGSGALRVGADDPVSVGCKGVELAANTALAAVAGSDGAGAGAGGGSNERERARLSRRKSLSIASLAMSASADSIRVSRAARSALLARAGTRTRDSRWSCAATAPKGDDGAGARRGTRRGGGDAAGENWSSRAQRPLSWSKTVVIYEQPGPRAGRGRIRQTDTDQQNFN